MSRLVHTLALVVSCVACNAVLGNEDATLVSDAPNPGAPGNSTAPPDGHVDGAAVLDEAGATTDAGSPSDDAGVTRFDAGVAPRDSGAPPTCPANQTLCGAVCVDLRSDPLNCGACMTVCAAPPMCNGGKCKHGGD